MTYDEALARLQAIVEDLEKEEAVSIDEYKQKAQEAKELLTYCRRQLTTLEEEMHTLFDGSI